MEIVGDLVVESRRRTDLPFHQLFLEPVACNLAQTQLHNINKNQLQIMRDEKQEKEKKKKTREPCEKVQRCWSCLMCSGGDGFLKMK